ncbi:MAG: HFX_2341 family transcriptional regulator domain-containing protein [Thermoplasmatota archaeon]
MSKNSLVATSHRDHPGEEVHIVPIGWELDRAVLPFLLDLATSRRLVAHKVYLLVPNPMGGKGFDADAAKALEGVARVEIRAVERKDPAGRHIEFEKLVAEISSICAKEMAANNRVHINISAGSKIASFAAGLVGMAYDVDSIYYVEPDKYADELPCEKCDHVPKRPRPLSSGMTGIKLFEPLKLDLPARWLMQTLGFMARHGDAPVSYIQILQFLSDVKDSPFKGIEVVTSPRSGRLELKDKKQEPAIRMRLLRTVIEPLEERGYVDSERNGRERLVRLTGQGRAYARFASAP